MNRFLMLMIAPFISKITTLFTFAFMRLYFLPFGKSLFASR
jgi:hypothetical protein